MFTLSKVFPLNPSPQSLGLSLLQSRYVPWFWWVANVPPVRCFVSSWTLPWSRPRGSGRNNSCSCARHRRRAYNWQRYSWTLWFFRQKGEATNPREKKGDEFLGEGSGVGMCSKKTIDVSNKIWKLNMFWGILVLQNVEERWGCWKVGCHIWKVEGISKLKIPKWKCGLELHMRCGNVCPLAFSPIDLLKGLQKKCIFSTQRICRQKNQAVKLGGTCFHLSGKTTSPGFQVGEMLLTKFSSSMNSFCEFFI